MADQIGSTYQTAPWKGLSKRAIEPTLELLEDLTELLDEEVESTEELVDEFTEEAEVETTDEADETEDLELLTLDEVATLELDEVTTAGWPEQVGRVKPPAGVLPVKPKVVDAPDPKEPL